MWQGAKWKESLWVWADGHQILGIRTFSSGPDMSVLRSSGKESYLTSPEQRLGMRPQLHPELQMGLSCDSVGSLLLYLACAEQYVIFCPQLDERELLWVSLWACACNTKARFLSAKYNWIKDKGIRLSSP